MFSDGCSDSDCWGCSSQSAWETFHINMFRLLMRVSPGFDVLAAVANAFEWSFEGGYYNCTCLQEGGGRRRKIGWRSFVMPRSILTSGSTFLLLILSSASIPTLSLCLSERRPPSLLHPLLLSSNGLLLYWYFAPLLPPPLLRLPWPAFTPVSSFPPPRLFPLLFSSFPKSFPFIIMLLFSSLSLSSIPALPPSSHAFRPEAVSLSVWPGWMGAI